MALDNKRHAVAVATALLLLVIGILGLVIDRGEEVEVIATGVRTRSSSSNATAVKYHECGYRDYPWPENTTGLPFLADVFRSPTLDEIVFVGTNRGLCQEEYSTNDDFAFNFGARKHTRFLCEFSDGTQMLSDYVHPSGPFPQAFTFRCTIPEQYRKADVGQDRTALIVSLYAVFEGKGKDDSKVFQNPRNPLASTVHASAVLEVGRNGSSSVKKWGNHSIPDIPVCSNVWPNDVTPPRLAIDAGQNATSGKKHGLVVFAMVKMVAQDMATFHGVTGANSKKVRNETTHMIEWIEYHGELGVSRFIIYDNDDAENVGRLKQLLLPYIERGIVTYVWFPLPYCEVEYGGWKGWPSARGQFAAEMSALHRYGHYGKYYGDFDVDEFLVLFPGTRGGRADSLLALLEDKLVKEDYDTVTFQPHMMAACNGARINPSKLRIETWRCFTGKKHPDHKLIMKPERMRYYMVHYPVMTVDWTTPKSYHLDEEKEGLIAHYRKKEEYMFVADSFDGIARSEFKNPTKRDFMDSMVPRIRKRVNYVKGKWYHKNNSRSVRRLDTYY